LLETAANLCDEEEYLLYGRRHFLRMALGATSPKSASGNAPVKHMPLADHFDDRAFMDCVNFLKVRLGLERSAKRMNLAKLGDRACEITADGHWRAL